MVQGLQMQRKLSKVLMVFLMFFGICIGPLSTAYAETLPFEMNNLDLPEPLSDVDVKRYKDIFALQQDKKWKEADKLIKALDSDLLLGRCYRNAICTRRAGGLHIKNCHHGSKNIMTIPPQAEFHGWPKSETIQSQTPKAPKKGYLNGYGRSSLGGSYIAIPTTRVGRASPSKTRQIAREIRYKIRSGWPSGGVICSRKAICVT